MSTYSVVLTTVPSRKIARAIIRLLLEQKLAACANLMPAVESHYWWNNKQEKSSEYLLILKTKTSFFKRIERVIRENHPYSVPEIIALPILQGSRKYLTWIRQITVGC